MATPFLGSTSDLTRQRLRAKRSSRLPRDLYVLGGHVAGFRALHGVVVRDDAGGWVAEPDLADEDARVALLGREGWGAPGRGGLRPGRGRGGAWPRAPWP